MLDRVGEDVRRIKQALYCFYLRNFVFMLLSFWFLLPDSFVSSARCACRIKPVFMFQTGSVHCEVRAEAEERF